VLNSDLRFCYTFTKFLLCLLLDSVFGSLLSGKLESTLVEIFCFSNWPLLLCISAYISITGYSEILRMAC
jgi:hypothetical protein